MPPRSRNDATPAREDAERRVRTIGMFVRGDASAPAAIVVKVDRGDVRADVSETQPLTDLAPVHERSAAGGTRGKVVPIPTA